MTFGSNPSTLVILPTITPYVDYPSANWMIYGDRRGPRAEYDLVALRRHSRPIGHFVFHPEEGGLIWDEVVPDRGYLYRDGQVIAAVDRGVNHSFLFALADGVTVDWHFGDFYLKPGLRTWQDAFHRYQDRLYR